MPSTRTSLTLLLTAMLVAETLSAQNRGVGIWLSNVTDPYKFREVEPINLSNSSRIDALLRGGNLYLSLQDTIALALENNLDIELQRYAPRLAEADLLGARAGGVARGVGAQLSQGTTQAGAGGALAVIPGVSVQPTQTGRNFASQSLDPVLTGSLSWGHRTTPLTNQFATGTNSLVSRTTAGSIGISQSYLTGTTWSLTFNNNRQEQNSGRNDFNPTTNGFADFQITQRLLQGRSLGANNRNIRIARNNIQASDLQFRQQVINTVSSAITLYWDLVSFNEDVKVRRQQLQLNEKLYNDNRKQVEIGTLAPIEIIRAEAEVARSKQDLLVAETQVLQQETILKNALSRTGVASPLLQSARIIPTDSIKLPETEEIRPIQDLIAQAMDNRPDLMQSRINIENARIGLDGTRNAMLPSVDAFIDLRNNGLAGAVNALPIPPIPGAPVTGPILRDPRTLDQFFLGGYSTMFGQILRRNFPDYSFGLQVNIPLRNRSAQADMVRDQLSLRQAEVRQQILVNQIRVDVQNALIALSQARARYQTATKTRELQERTLDAEQKKYALGASTIFFVIQAQRDLAAAQAAEVAALAAYSRARVELDRATGQTIEANQIIIDEARKGMVTRGPSSLPVVQQ